jgi:hypothetical protein
MANTYTQIGTTVTVGAGGTASIDFTSIPSTYTDLLLKISARSAGAVVGTTVGVQFNGDTGANYSRSQLYGTGSGAAGSDSQSSMGHAQSGPTNANTSTANIFSNTEYYIPNYTNSSQKPMYSDSVQETAATASYMGLMANVWTGTAAISSIKVISQNGNFMQNTTASLYGIKKN